MVAIMAGFLAMDEHAAAKRAKMSESNRRYYVKNAEAMRERGRAYRRNNLTDVQRAQRDAAKTKRSQAENWVRMAVYRARRQAKAGGLPFNLTNADVHMPDTCVIRQVPFKFGSLNHSDTPSLDRLNPALGYVVGNVRVISFLANRCKQNVVEPEVFDRVAAYMRGEI